MRKGVGCQHEQDLTVPYRFLIGHRVVLRNSGVSACGRRLPAQVASYFMMTAFSDIADIIPVSRFPNA